MNFFAELKRRHIYRVAAAYAVVAWVLLQLVANVAPILDLPPWVARSILLLLVWTVEPAVASPTTATRTDFVLAGALIVVIALISYQELRPAPTPIAAQQTAPPQAGRAAQAAQSGDLSIAVLPFENLSGDAAQEFFSDGMTEEVTAALAKIRGLRVIARSSAFQFKSQNRDIQSIAQQLHVSHFIEGSVRKDGNQLRITAQLIKAEDGTHVWAENYDRQLTGVFAIQEDIAQAIAGALRLPLGLKQGALLVANRSIGPDSYEKYLRARVLVRTRLAQQASNAVSLLEEITAHDPDYAPAWALLSMAYDVTPQAPAWYSGESAEIRRLAEGSLPKAETAARRAIQLDANLADGYAALGRLQVARGQLLAADQTYARALALDPSHPDTLQFFGNLLAEVGHLKEAVKVMQNLRAEEPFAPTFNLNAAMVSWLNGQDEEAIAILESVPPVAAREVDLAQIYAANGRYKEAADQLLKIPAATFFPGILPEAEQLLRSAPATRSSPQTTALGRLGFVFLHSGAPLRALEFHEAGVNSGYVIAITTAELWHPSYAGLRKDERFKALVRKAGIVDYWRVKGWPDLCRPTGADDFVCD